MAGSKPNSIVEKWRAIIANVVPLFISGRCRFSATKECCALNTSLFLEKVYSWAYKMTSRLTILHDLYEIMKLPTANTVHNQVPYNSGGMKS